MDVYQISAISENHSPPTITFSVPATKRYFFCERCNFSIKGHQSTAAIFLTVVLSSRLYSLRQSLNSLKGITL